MTMSLIRGNFYFFLFVHTLYFFTLAFSIEFRNPEVEALTTIREGLVDPHGALSNWDEDSADPCSWSMITCNSDNLVTALGAPSQGLSGSLSWMIANLTNLKQVLLQNNNITGHIPKEMGYLPNLQTLDMSNNKLCGHIPESLGFLKHLQYLDLSFNNLSGPVPTFPTKTFNILGNPLICGNHSSEKCSGLILARPLSFPINPSPDRTNPTRLAVALGVSLSFVSMLVILFGYLFWKRNKIIKQSILDITDVQEEDLGLTRLGNLRNFTFKELQNATENFSVKNILGAGGFGNVYRGKLGDGTFVAVKRLKDLTGTTGESQFRTELEMISLAVHRNLLRVIGYCATPNERLLIYPYMSNGSVASRLRGKPALDWQTRKRIAIGAARGLLYLHEQCDPKIIHRDVKAANVLLDDYLEAVVGDFGLAKLLDHAESHVTTAVRGTVGHIAPEYLSTGQSSEKTDVFGFGILLLELITGMRALEFGKSVNQKGVMLEWVKKIQKEKKTELLVDRELGTNYDQIEVGEMLQVAILCTQYLPAHRPKMSEVVRMLEGDGLAEKWAASHNYIHAPAKFSCKSKSRSNEDIDRDQSSMFGLTMTMDDDYDAHCMELSGPR
ncbi:probable LRR receptor-like serine/threonine-protein kinase at2g23950 [Phtheirospermum japonicum]|uniref:non-specific serine/threonine protein kinase n=1 Tax=Phtheirospermum japonicum TaxID=374723 RepID=A0A830BEU2_9LAMI|nr:probable LRR receptor-like serine/threonine-protein kinase at2g23950 [Phtheirospermum japonicum]